MTASNVLDPRSLARIAGVVSCVTAVIAVIAAITGAAAARHWLGFTFAGVPPRIGEAGTILLNNGRFVLGIGGAAWVAQLKVRRRSAGKHGSGDAMLTSIALGADAVVLIAVLVNAALVGVSLAAYGGRIVIALLPHGPFEVCAYCVAMNLFLNARRRPIYRRDWVVAALVSASLLTVAAVLETFAWLG
jgi:hypothetical protein